MTSSEDLRSIYGAGIIDKEDDVVSITQALSNLDDVNSISLSRIAMVTGIPKDMLIGENRAGLNSSGDNQKQAFQDLLTSIQDDYLLRPINELMLKMGKEPIKFKVNQGQTVEDKIKFESAVIDNALKLEQLGEDSATYLQENDIVKKRDSSDIFAEVEDELEEEEEASAESIFPDAGRDEDV